MRPCLNSTTLYIVHRPGRLHCNADGASRPLCKQCWGKDPKVPWRERADEITDPIGMLAITIEPEISEAKMVRLQANDAAIAPVASLLTENGAPSADRIRALPLDSRNLWPQRPAVLLQSGVLVRKLDQTVQLIVPDILRKRLFDQAHAGPLAAHLGVDKTLQQLKRSYYWPGMRRDINLWYSTCEKCARSKRPPSRPHGKLQKIFTGAPLDLVTIDILSGA